MPITLADGLVLRSLGEGYASDRDRLPDFYAMTNAEGEDEHVKEGVRLWIREFIYRHPTVTPDDLFVVVDPAQDEMIVSATLLIPQRWRYEDVLLKAGRPEMCGTHPDYRRRGLQRALFNAVHARSAALGHHLQGITGIPYFYRQFGYSMTFQLGYRAFFQLSALPEPSPEPPVYSLRHATSDDIADITRWNENFAAQRLVTDAYTPAELLYEITGRHPGYYPHTDYHIIVDAAGQGVGYIVLLDALYTPYRLRCEAFVVGTESNYLAAFEPVMQAVKQWAVARYGHCPAMLALGCGLHDTLEPLIAYSPGGSFPPVEDAWYLRVPDAAAFLLHIRPVLERRLRGSGAHGYSGDLRIGFYDHSGLELRFQHGQLISVDSLNRTDGYDVQFPWHSFLNVVFGSHSVEDLHAVLPDVWPNGKAVALLNILFPKRKSWLNGLA